ncbi:MAG: hypothetical protein CFE44_06605 [Burkholderiales bacterium PBB4]|nr:MAG: hypothetical protein CFE44_06605 [Burkholderiales bacterium PBB4]
MEIVRKQHASLWRAATILVLMWLCMIATLGWQSWKTERTHEVQRLSTVVRFGAQTLGSFFGKFRNGLGVWAATLIKPDNTLDLDRIQFAVRQMQQRHPEVIEVVFVAPDGRVVASSSQRIQQPGTGYQHPSVLAAVQQKSARTVFEVGPPMQSAVQAGWQVPIRHYVRDTQGVGLGYLAVAVSVDTLQEMWRAGVVDPRIALGVIGDDGYLRARFPVFGTADPSEVYGKPRSGALIGYLRAHGFPDQGSIEGATSVDKLSAFNVFARIEGADASFFAGLPVDAVLHHWWEGFQSALVLTILLGGLGVWSFRFTRRQQIRWLAEQAQSDRISHELAAIVTASGSAIVSMDPAGVCTSWNPAAERLLGYTSGEILGKSVTPLVPEDLFAQEFALHQQVLKGDLIAGHQTQRLHKEGRRVDVEISISPLKNADGEVVGLSNIVNDIGNLLRTQRYMRIADKVFASISHGLLVSDAHRRVLSVNPAFTRITGYSPDEVIGNTCAMLQGPKTSPEKLAAMCQAMQDKVAYHGVVINYRKDGTTFWNELSIEPILEANGESRFFVGFVRDITARKLAERASLHATRHIKSLSARLLSAQETERRRLALEMHDDLGQTLTAIKITLQTRALTQSQTDGADPQGTIAMIDAAIKSVRQMALVLRPTMLDDLGLASALQWLAEQTSSTSGIQVTVQGDWGDLRLPGDVETACFRVVQEALTNVQRHAAAKSVHITLTRSNGGVEVCVADDGRGFDAPAKFALARQGHSLGVLGMKERAELLGGSLSIESAPGAGTSVCLLLPLTQPSAVVPEDIDSLLEA